MDPLVNTLYTHAREKAVWGVPRDALESQLFQRVSEGRFLNSEPLNSARLSKTEFTSLSGKLGKPYNSSSSSAP